jgi:transposase
MLWRRRPRQLMGNITVMLLVEIEKPEKEPLSKWFSELRDWLDASHCASSTFARTGRRLDRLIYRISFEDAALAHQFLLRFSRYSPTIRRANPFERDQLRKMGQAVAAAAG